MKKLEKEEILNLENYFISLFKSKYIGDDAAIIDDFCYSKDAFFENVHFKKEWMSYKQIAQKAMLVNLSDAIAMNATPLYALLSVAMPKTMSRADMLSLAKGFKSVAKAYGVEIVGGDTISNTKLDITITIISKTKKPLFRKGIRANHLMAYTGELGRSKKDLRKLFNGGSIHQKSKFVNIQLRKDFISKAKRLLLSGMDISDGLLSDLDKMASVNRIGFTFNKKITSAIGCSGEEYEMLIAFDKRSKKAIVRRAEQTRTKITIFAKASRNRYKNRCKTDHF